MHYPERIATAHCFSAPPPSLTSASPVLSEAEQKRLRIEAERLDLVYTQAPIALLSMLLSGTALTFCLWDVIPPVHLFRWLALSLLVILGRSILAHAYKRRTTGWHRLAMWRRWFVCGAGAAGVTWAFAGIVLFPAASQTHQLILIFILCANATGSIAFLSPLPGAFLSFFLPMTIVLIGRVALASSSPAVMTALGVFYIVALISTARRLSESVTQSLQLRFDNLALVSNLEKITERFELAVQGANEGLWDATIETTADGRFLASSIYYSPRYQHLLGFTDVELPNTLEAWQELLHPEDRKRVLHALRDHLGKQTPYTEEFRLRMKSGEYRWFSGKGQAVWDAARNPIRMAGSLQDITTRKEAEQLKDELVSTVSHELRTPLTSLRGFAELMLTRSFTKEKQREFLTIIHTEATRLTNLINDFLDLQRMESGRQVYEFQPVSVATVLRDTLTIFMNEDSKHTFALEAGEELPAAQADVDRLRQVFANLLSNAVKYSPQGGVVRVGARRDGDHITVWVADQGIGIPLAAQARLFSRFFRVNNQDTRSIGGTGLGLALVKEIVEAHRGRVWVESAEGAGSTFFFTLPLADAALPPQSEPREAA